MTDVSAYVRYVHSWTSRPIRDEQDAAAFVRWLLDGEVVAKRPGKRGRRQKNFLQGKHECIQGKTPHRSDDFAERVCIGVEAFLRAGCEPKRAYRTLAELPFVERRLGHSLRGRHSKRAPHDQHEAVDRRAETIRSLVRRYLQRLRLLPFAELVNIKIAHYRLCQMQNAALAEYFQPLQNAHSGACSTAELGQMAF